jgi:DNA-binding NtrC family response regulator
VRELENAVERAVVLGRNPVLGVDDLPESLQRSVRGERITSLSPSSDATGGAVANGVYVAALDGGWNPTPLVKALLEPEKQIILAALEANNWNRQETAKQLEINRTTLYKKIKHFNLDRVH